METKLWQWPKNMNSRAYNPANAMLAMSGGMNLLLWIIVLATFPKNSPTAILHYTAGVGIDFIGEGWQIITLPGIGALLLLVNTVLARFIEKINQPAFWVLWGSMPLLQFILLATYGILLALNT